MLSAHRPYFHGEPPTLGKMAFLRTQEFFRCDQTVTKTPFFGDEIASDLRLFGGGGRESNPPDEDHSSQPL